jgi:uncharacterized protein YdhG (YjbR/CyaY superfamily)
MAGTLKAIDDYLAGLSNDERNALEKLRKAIRAAAPKAEDCLSYRRHHSLSGGESYTIGFGTEVGQGADRGERRS